MTNSIKIRRRAAVALFTVVLWVGLAGAPAYGQIYLGTAPDNIDGNQVCTFSGLIQVSDTEDGCTAGGQDITLMRFEGGSSLVTEAGATSNFGGAVNFNSNNVQFNSANVAFGGGTTAFNSTVSFTGSSVTFSTGTTFNNAAAFNAAITTSGITNTGGISTTGLLSGSSAIFTNDVVTGTLTSSAVSVGAGGLSVQSGANVNMGSNIVHGVASGVANTDAVNVSQLNAVTGNITALQTTVNTQSNQINALQATQNLVQDQVDILFDLRSTDRRDMKQGVASAMAMASAPMPSEPGRVAYAVNGATFRGEYAVGGSISYRLPGSRPFSVNAGFSFAGNKNNGARVGIAGEF